LNDDQATIVDSPAYLYWLATGRHPCDCEAACNCSGDTEDAES
jgi:hypothetical protein